MAEDKNKTDSDRIKELLAQLRATMDLEEENAADPSEKAEEENTCMLHFIVLNCMASHRYCGFLFFIF